MKRSIPSLFCALLAGSLAAQAPATPPKTHLKVGDMAPDFTLSSSQKKPIKLSDFRGKQGVVLAFFPAAFTGGCSKEMAAYTANIAKFEGMGYQVLSISTDNQPTLNHWAEELKAPFPFLSDFMRKVSADYGVLSPERGIANRATFVVDPAGKIQYIEEGSSAVDISGTELACARIKKS